MAMHSRWSSTGVQRRGVAALALPPHDPSPEPAGDTVSRARLDSRVAICSEA